MHPERPSAAARDRGIAAMKGAMPEGDADVQMMLDFLAASNRGIVR